MSKNSIGASSTTGSIPYRPCTEKEKDYNPPPLNTPWHRRVLPSPWVELFDNFFQPGFVDMGVDLGGGNIGMTQH